MNIIILPKDKEKKNHKIIKDASIFFLNKTLGKRKQKLIKTIYIKLVDSLDYGESVGEAKEVVDADGKFDFYLKLVSKTDFPNMIQILAHEFVHIKQTVKKELVVEGDYWYWMDEPKRKFKDKWYSFTIAQQCDKLPWEREAYGKQIELAREFFWVYYSTNP